MIFIPQGQKVGFFLDFQRDFLEKSGFVIIFLYFFK